MKFVMYLCYMQYTIYVQSCQDGVFAKMILVDSILQNNI